mmetsp:Transcript_28254/g.42690  ORF Transcript_28254/g.42690 Transcript_28254/m.42690 type:complete len:81 (+) Transcript_28254:120-362(+)
MMKMGCSPAPLPLPGTIVEPGDAVVAGHLPLFGQKREKKRGHGASVRRGTESKMKFEELELRVFWKWLKAREKEAAATKI